MEDEVKDEADDIRKSRGSGYQIKLDRPYPMNHASEEVIDSVGASMLAQWSDVCNSSDKVCVGKLDSAIVVLLNIIAEVECSLLQIGISALSADSKISS